MQAAVTAKDAIYSRHVIARPAPTKLQRRQAMAAAIAAIRETAGPNGKRLTATEAARRLGITRQAYDAWEAGKIHLILSQDTQADLARAFQITVPDLLQEYYRQLEAMDLQLPSGEREDTLDDGGDDDFDLNAAMVGGQARPKRRIAKMLMPDDNIRPYASLGTTIVYDRDLWPRSGEGVVIEDKAGRRSVKIFDRIDDTTVYVQERHPGPRELTYPRDDVSIFRVIARLD